MQQPDNGSGPGAGRTGWRRQYTDLLGHSAVGIEMGAAVGIGILIGFLLDRHFVVTNPWLTLLFMALGMVAAARAFIRTARELRAKGRKEGRGGQDQPGG